MGVQHCRTAAEAPKIINATWTSNDLQHEAIQAQRALADSPDHTTVYIPVGPIGLPIVHVPPAAAGN